MLFPQIAGQLQTVADAVGTLQQSVDQFGDQLGGALQVVNQVNGQLQTVDTLVGGFQRIDATVVELGSTVAALIGGFQRIDATLAAINEHSVARDAGVSERLDSFEGNVLKRLEALEVAKSTPPLQIANGISELLARAQRGEALSERRVALPHPFSNMTRESWAGGVRQWLQYAPQILADCGPRGCPACAGTTSEFIFKSYDGYPYHECETCKTWFVPLQVNQALFERYFAASPEGKRYSDYMLSQDEVAEVMEADRLRFKSYYTELKALAPEAKTLMDVGCGVGTSLDVAGELGIQAIGMEVNASARAAGAARGRKILAPGEKPPWPKADLITMWESLEHMDDAEAAIRFAKRSLSPHGLFAVSVPNLDSPIISSLRGDSFHINGGSGFAGHINLFSKRSLTLLLQRCGFEVVRARGQYSMNLQELVAYHLGLSRGARDYLERGDVEISLPEATHQLLSAIGPIVSEWERDFARGPILHIVARHKG